MISIKKITRLSLFTIVVFSVFVIWLNFYFVPEVRTYASKNQSYEESITEKRSEMELSIRVMGNIHQQLQKSETPDVSDALQEAFNRNKGILELKSSEIMAEIDGLKFNWDKLNTMSLTRHGKSILELSSLLDEMNSKAEELFMIMSMASIEDIPFDSLEAIKESNTELSLRLKNEHRILNDAIVGDLNAIINIMLIILLTLLLGYNIGVIRFISKDYIFIHHSFKALGSNWFEFESLPTVKSLFKEEKEMKTYIKRLFDERKFISDIREILLEHYIVDDVIESLFESLEKVMGIDRIGIAFVDYDRNLLIAEYGVSNYDEVLLGPGFEVEIGSSRLSKMLVDKQPFMTSDLELDFMNRPESPALALLSNEGIKSNLVLPMTMGDAVFGMVFLSSKEKRFFGQEHLMLAEKLIYEIKGLLNRSYFTKVIFSKITTSFSELVDQKDNETGDHINRMVKYSVAIAKGLRLKKLPGYEIDRKFILEIERNASSHDIGKVGIPDSVLKKPGKLNPDEWVTMKTHAAIGADIFRDLRMGLTAFDPDFYKMAEEIARHHHEKWDGTGYPDGLKGTEIPLSARIVALADVFDALTSRRVYKEAFSLDDSLDIIRNSKGNHLDPVIVDVFFENLEVMKAIMFGSK
ncbi:MAG: HD domain-containing phosphohydrolase [Bacillota bacterium]|nr:HD domain-containing phosphohydrolase [Bacillota bacterium]